MASGLIDIMKRSAIEAMEAGKPCDLRYGVVISDAPLKVEITNQFILEESVLLVPQYLTDYEIEVTIKPEYGWDTQPHTHSHSVFDTYTSGGSSSEETHKHDIHHEKKKILIHGALKVGDKVALIRQAGGQQFFIIDRFPKEE